MIPGDVLDWFLSGKQETTKELDMTTPTPSIDYTRKVNNYVLRSRHTEALLRILVLSMAGRVMTNGKGVGGRFVKANGTWAGNCGWEVKQLVQRGLIEYRGFGKYYATTEGAKATFAALFVLNRNADEIFQAVERIER